MKSVGMVVASTMQRTETSVITDVLEITGAKVFQWYLLLTALDLASPVAHLPQTVKTRDRLAFLQEHSPKFVVEFQTRTSFQQSLLEPLQ